ncbi:MAG: molybdenum cofactor biosynthesis protein MoaE [Gemmatimonadales bacterium]
MSFLTSQPIEPVRLAESIAAPSDGAHVTFTGVVRDHHAGRQVISLGYSAYTPMAERVCQELVDEARRRWSVRVALQHRLGDLQIGEVAVVIVVAAAHRGVAFDACQWLIDELKRLVPIWKRETYADGSTAWVDPTATSGVIAVKP